MFANDAQPDLTHGERLIIRTVRLMALKTFCEGRKGHFEQACGGAGVEAYRTLEVFFQQLSLHGRRKLSLSAPADVRLTSDEATLLDAFGCAQSEDYRALDERLTGLLGAAPPTALGGAACVVAHIMAMGGLLLRPRATPAETPAICRYHETWLPLAAE